MKVFEKLLGYTGSVGFNNRSVNEAMSTLCSTITYESDDTILLIVDPYNDFMSKDGKYYERTKETAEAVGFYDNMRKLIPAVRESRIQVIIVPHHRWRESDYKG